METGVACFALKFCKSQSPPQNNKTVYCQLDELGSVLIDEISKELEGNCAMKVICAGKIVNPYETLREQGKCLLARK